MIAALGAWVPDRRLLAELIRHLERCYPEEGCGVLVEGRSGVRFVPLRNRLASASAFAFDPAEHLAVELEAARRDERITVILHSHPDGSAELSARDRTDAVTGGTPLFPGLAYLVVSIRGGTADAARLFTWMDGDLRMAADTRLPSGRSPDSWCP